MPSEVRFAELRKLLESHGWTLDRVKGSHHIFVRPGAHNVVLPVHRGKCKAVYRRLILEAIETLHRPKPRGRAD